MKTCDIHFKTDEEIKTTLEGLCKKHRRNQRQMIEFLILQEKNK